MSTPVAYHRACSTRLAFLHDGPNHPHRCGLFWLGGFKSVMTGEKATRLAQWAVSQGRSMLRFDYSGHGASGGEFRQGTISRWLDEAVVIFREVAPGPRIILGSSMGGWLALLLAKRLNEHFPDDVGRVHGLVLLAPATDMTAQLIRQGMTAEERECLAREGVVARPSIYGDGPYEFTRQLLDDGDLHQLLNAAYPAAVPVRILHGEQDEAVPWQHGLATYSMIEGDDVTFTLVKGGDHRLSDERSLDLLVTTAAALCTRADAVIAQRQPAPADPPDRSDT
ncbi:alpha/beta hydrolase [Rhodoligotrophos defluvii]|uniref:alpha/beta hydrolase n=1 Tax=Rhodoligotrophos defluvii TaxID=2561934 RepID=UPI0010CA14A1|nr:alpha/beta fold hydrolase [Rhodoligotrophos defluvii]